MLKTKKAIIMVDAYGPARLFREYIKEKGLVCIHIQGTPKPLPRLKMMDLEKYDYCITHDGDPENTIVKIHAACERLEVEILEIIAGVEPGVLLADHLSHHFKLHSNGINKSTARRDKFAMACVLEKANITIPKYLKTNSLDKLSEFFEAEHGQPIVLKPLDSAGSNGVHICHTLQDVGNAYKSIIGAVNNMGSINRELLAQSFLKGTEYFVNTVSHKGKHYVTDIWRAEKKPLPGYANVYDKNFLIDSKSIEYNDLSGYVFQVLDALEIKYGASHTEVIITENGPVIVESASRISGALEPIFNQACLGYDQIQITIESYISPEIFMKRIGNPYPFKKAGLQMYLSAEKSGIVKDSNVEETLKDIDGVISYSLKFEKGGAASKTIDLSSSIGVAHIIGETQQDIISTYNNIKSSIDNMVLI